MSVSRPGGDFWVAPAEIDPVDLYGAAGVGVFVGFVGSVLSHVWDGAALPILAFAYLIGMSRFRGWKEYAALLSMASTVVLYYSAYDVVTLLSLNVWGIVAVVAATILATFVCGMAVAAYSGHARKNVRATPPRGPFGGRRAEAVPAEDRDSWEVWRFARLRRSRGKARALVLVYPYVVSGAMLLVPLLVQSKAISAIAICVAFFYVVVAGRQFHYDKRLRSGSAARELLWDVRPPVLLLRSFLMDAVPAHSFDRKIGFFRFLNWMDKHTFEEYLAAEFEHIGPVVAVGRPGETIAPSGAARAYLADDVWQDWVLTHAQSSQCVLMVVDDSPGMMWELKHIPELVGLQRVIFVVPPYPEDDIDEDVSQPPGGAAGWRSRWATLRESFPILPEVPAGIGAVLYDEAGGPVLVESGKTIEARVAGTRKAWEELRGSTSDGGEVGDGEAAERALRAAAVVTAISLGVSVPRAVVRSVGGSPTVARGDAAAGIAELEHRLAEMRRLVGAEHPAAGVLHYFLGRLYQQTAETSRAREQYVLALTTLDRSPAISPGVALSARWMLAAILIASGDLEGAQTQCETALSALAKLPGDSSSIVDDLLGIPQLDGEGSRFAEALLHAQLGRVRQLFGDLPSAHAAYESALPVLDSSPASYWSSIGRWQLGWMHNNYGRVLFEQGDFLASRDESEIAIEFLESGEDVSRLHLAIAYGNQGRTFQTLGTQSATRASYERAVDILDEWMAEVGPAATATNPGLGNIYANLAIELSGSGEVDAALSRAEQAIALTRAAVGSDDGRMAPLRYVHGTILAKSGDTEAARSELECAVGISERALGALHPETEMFRASLGALPKRSPDAQAVRGTQDDSR